MVINFGALNQSRVADALIDPRAMRDQSRSCQCVPAGSVIGTRIRLALSRFAESV